MHTHKVKILVFDSGFPLIFAAGVVALFSPCGFPMLPGYISYYMGVEISYRKAIPLGMACSFGLIMIFSFIGFLATIIGGFFSLFTSLLELIAGLIMIFMGVGMIFELRISKLWIPIISSKKKGIFGIFLYGITYGLATIGCSAPIFLSILSYAIANGGLIQGLLTFIVYASGMGFPIIIITILMVKVKNLMLNKVVMRTQRLHKISGTVLISIGLYLTYFYIASQLF